MTQYEVRRSDPAFQVYSEKLNALRLLKQGQNYLANRKIKALKLKDGTLYADIHEVCSTQAMKFLAGRLGAEVVYVEVAVYMNTNLPEVDNS